MSTTNVENNNPGPASIIMVNGNKNLEIACSVIMGEGDVVKNPLNITDATTHECEYDEKTGKAVRKYDGKIQEADSKKMKATRDRRVAQGRKVTIKQQQTADIDR